MEKPGHAHRRRRALKVSLLAAALAGSAAVPPHAQTGRAWVDPPARPEAPPVEAGKAAQSPGAAAPAERPAGSTAGRAAAPPKPAEAPPGENRSAASALRPETDKLMEKSAEKPDEAARQLAVDYLDFWSGPNAIALEAMPGFYAPHVAFHGREMPARALFEIKRSFVERWPVRSYQARPESMRVECRAEAQLCRVGTLFEFIATDPRRRRRSEGVATLELEVSTAGARPVIVAEDSSIIRRGKTTRLPRERNASAERTPEP